MKPRAAATLASFAVVLGGGILFATAPTSFTCSGTDCVAAQLALLRGPTGVGVSAVGLLGLTVTVAVGLRDLGNRLGPRTKSWARWTVPVGILGLLLTTLGLVLFVAADYESIACTLSSCAGLTFVFAIQPVALGIFGGGFALGGLAVFLAARSLRPPIAGPTARSAPSALAEADSWLALAGGSSFAVGALLAFVPVTRIWHQGSCDGLCTFWSDIVFPFRIPGILIWFSGAALLAYVGLRRVRTAGNRLSRARRRGIQALLIAGVVVAAGFASAAAISTPGLPLVLVPAGTVLHLEVVGGDPWVYFFNVSATTVHLTGAWESEENLSAVFMNADYAIYGGFCPPPTSVPPPVLSHQGSFDSYFPPGEHNALTWECITPPTTITVVQAIIVAAA